MDGILVALAVGVAALILSWASDRWLLPWRARRSVRKLLQRLPAAKEDQRTQPKYTISFDELGFAVGPSGRSPDPAGTMRWSEVKRVTAFKEDWGMSDCICLAFGVADDTARVVGEDLGGWQAFVEALPEHLPGCRAWSSWCQEVALPAFATNLTEIYDREKVVNGRS